jgi:DNA end-binding protein Ku
MAQHAYWTGHIRLSLVTFPVRVYPAIAATEKIRLHKYDRRTGQRIHYQNLNEEGKAVNPNDVVKGYEYEKGSFIPIEDKEIDNLRQESKHTIELVQFSDLSSIDPIYYESPYFVAPDGTIAQEAYLTLREALKKSGTVAIGQVVLSNKERMVAIKPYGRGMVMETLRYNYEVREADDYFGNIEPAVMKGEQLDLALELIKRKKADFDPRKFRDLYQEGLKEIIKARLEKRPARIKEEKPMPGKVIDIMDALRKSLQQSEDSKAPKKKKYSRHKRAG